MTIRAEDIATRRLFTDAFFRLLGDNPSMTQYQAFSILSELFYSRYGEYLFVSFDSFRKFKNRHILRTNVH